MVIDSVIERRRRTVSNRSNVLLVSVINVYSVFIDRVPEEATNNINVCIKEGSNAS